MRKAGCGVLGRRVMWAGEEWGVSAISQDGRLQLKKELKGRTMYAGSISRHGQGLKFVRGNYTA